MPPARWGAGGGAEGGAFGVASFIKTGGVGSWESPYTGVYWVEVANFNTDTQVIELPFGAGIIWRIKRIRMLYIGSAAGVRTYPTVNMIYGGASTIFPLGPAQLTNFATDILEWNEMSPWILSKLASEEGSNVSVNQRANITLNHAGYAATDDYRLVIELEWVME